MARGNEQRLTGRDDIPEWYASKAVLLTLRATLYIADRPAGARKPVRKTIQYAVDGLPPGKHAVIGNREDRWQILREKDGALGFWEGNYETAEAALAVLEGQTSF